MGTVGAYVQNSVLKKPDILYAVLKLNHEGVGNLGEIRKIIIEREFAEVGKTQNELEWLYCQPSSATAL